MSACLSIFLYTFIDLSFMTVVTLIVGPSKSLVGASETDGCDTLVPERNRLAPSSFTGNDWPVARHESKRQVPQFHGRDSGIFAF